ncbi:MAG: DHHW family protein [Ruminococcus callidus]|nr:DHHW family protein [Ruminococcus sp.]MDY6145328.1 DHHW family protein [Ruminococcus callidus]
MRKKNSNSSVPSGMHSLAQRSQQERRQKMEQQRVRTAPQEPMRVPPQQPAHFGRQPMQQVPPPPVQKPEKALSQEALQELQQQATQQPEESAVYNRFFADISVEEPQTPKKSAPQKTKAAPPTNSAEPEKPAPKMPPVRDARAMPQMPASAKPAAEPQQAEPVQPTPEPPKPVEPQATAESATVSPELLQQVAAMVQQDATGKATLTPELLQKIVAMAQQQTTANPVVSAVSESPAEPQAVPTPEPVAEPAPPQKKSRPARPQRRAPQMPVQTAAPEAVQQPIPEPEPQSESEPTIASPFITTAMLRQMKAEGKTLDDLQTAEPQQAEPTPVRRYQGKSAAETTAAPQPEPVRPSFRPVKPQDISIDTAAPEPIPEWFSEEEPPQVAEQRTKYLKNRQPRESVAELTGAAEKKPRAIPNGKQSSKAARFFRELFLEDAPIDPEQQKPVLPLTRNTAPQQSEAVVPPQPIAAPLQQSTAEPVAPPMPETAAPAPEQPVITSVKEASASSRPTKRPVISHAREEEPEPEPQLESAAFYNRLFNDFPESSEQPVPPTEEEMAQQQHKKDVIESVKGAVSEAEQLGNPPHKKRLTKREYMQRKAQRFSKTMGVSLLSGVVVVVAVVLLLAPRSTISYEENRLLAEKPKFSLTSLLDGSYTSGWSEYYNDTVPFRSKLKKTISAMMQWTGVQSEEDTVFFGNVSQVKKKTTTPVATTESVETTVAVAAGSDETNTEPAVTTTVVTTTEDPNDEPAAEIGEGIILDHKRAVCVYGGSFSVGQDYAETLNAYQQDLGSDVQVYSLVAPTAVSYYLPEEYANYTASETENIDNINSYLNSVKPVDVYNALKPHTAEAIYARTDHHWLPLGAYYAAEAFAKVADVPFASLSDYDTATKKDYVGSMYTYTESAVLLDNPEEFTYYIPKNKYKTTYYSTSFTDPTEGDLLMNLDGYDNSMYYLVFMGGDDKITHVETDCKNGRTLVIFKDSYGNALVPCLTSSFENIYVCDMRYFELNAIDFCKQVGCTDLLFAMNTFSATGGNESYLESNRVQ